MKKLSITPPLLDVVPYVPLDIIYSSYDDDDIDEKIDFIDDEDDVW